jgi:hypothetical protein
MNYHKASLPTSLKPTKALIQRKFLGSALMNMGPLCCNEIHKDMPIAKHRHARILICLMHFSFIIGPQKKAGIQLMDALLNYPCFTFQNEKYLSCPSILHIG